ncbi:MAG: hypothetical protein AAFU77_15340 [Myxococcota bacterium]
MVTLAKHLSVALLLLASCKESLPPDPSTAAADVERQAVAVDDVLTVSDAAWNRILYGTGDSANPNGGRFYSDSSTGMTFPESMTRQRLDDLRSFVQGQPAADPAVVVYGDRKILNITGLSGLSITYRFDLNNELVDMYPTGGLAQFDSGGNYLNEPSDRITEWKGLGTWVRQKNSLPSIRNDTQRTYLCDICSPPGWYDGDGELGRGLGIGALPERESNELTVINVAVGQGNCIVVECPFNDPNDKEALIVDCGTERKTLDAGGSEGFFGLIETLTTRSGKRQRPRPVTTPRDFPPLLQRLADNSKVHLVLTHSDADHINYVPYLLSEYEGYDPLLPKVDRLFFGNSYGKYPRNQGGSSTWIGRHPALIDAPTQEASAGTAPPLDFFHAYSFKASAPGNRELPEFKFDFKVGPGLVRKRVGRGIEDRSSMTGRLTCGTAQAEILSVNAGWSAESTNPNSIVLELVHGGRRVVLTGDAEGVTLDDALSKMGPGSEDRLVDIMVAPHHGAESNGSACDYWASETQPEYVVFSHGSASGFRHPRPDAFTRFERFAGTTTPHPVPVCTGGQDQEFRESDKLVYSTYSDGTVVFRVRSDGAVTSQCFGPWNQGRLGDAASWCSEPETRTYTKARQASTATGPCVSEPSSNSCN